MHFFAVFETVLPNTYAKLKLTYTFKA